MKPAGAMDGVVIGGRFEVESKLGQGGMATVYRANDRTTGKTVALKILPEGLLKEPEFVSRFEREAASIAHLDHPNIIKIYARGRHEGVPYYAMEYLPYPDLEGVLKERGTLPKEEVLEIALGVARALHETHQMELYHRDIKPANVVIADGPRPVLMDFGLVRDTNRTQLTATGAVMGTPLYMSPELIQGRKATAPSDIYQTGLLVYEMLSGRRAHAGDTMMEVAERCMTGDYDPVERHCPELPANWATCVANMLLTDEDERYPTARALMRDLVRLRKGEAVARREGGVEEISRTDATPAARPVSTASSSSFLLASGAFKAGQEALTKSIPPLPGDKPLPVWVKPALLFCTIAVVSMLADFSADVAPRAIEVVPGLTGAVIRWKTGDPTASFAEARVVGETAWTPVPRGGEPDGGVTDHVLDLVGYEQGQEIEFRLLGPSGPVTAPRRIRLGRVALGELDVTALPGGETRVSLVPSVTADCVLVVPRGREELELAMKPGASGALEARIPAPRPAFSPMRLVLTTEAGDLVEVDLTAEILRRAADAAREVANFDVERAASEILLSKDSPHKVGGRFEGRIGDDEDPEAHRARVAPAEAKIEAYARRHTPRASLDYLRALTPWILESDAVPDAQRFRVYEALDHYFGFEWFLLRHGYGGQYGRMPRDWGDFQETRASRLADAEPVVMAPDSREQYSLILNRRRGHILVDLPEAPDPAAFAELDIKLNKRLKYNFAMRFKINDAGWITVYGSRPAVWSGQERFFHGFPASALKKGPNRFEVDLVNQAGNMMSGGLYIKAAALRIGPEAAPLDSLPKLPHRPKKPKD